METTIEHCNCGSTEFISDLNSYDIYQIEDGKLCFQKSEPINEEIKLYCRDCCKEYKFDNFKIPFGV